MNINLNFITRFFCALLCVTGSFWMVNQLPQSSAFSMRFSMIHFDIWHGLVLFASFIISLIMAGYLARS